MVTVEPRAEIIHANDAISRIIAHTCRQPGLSNVLVELFDYDSRICASDKEPLRQMIWDVLKSDMRDAIASSISSFSLVELFDYDGDELYFEEIPQLYGKTLHETLNLFPKAVVFGIRKEDGPHLNPPIGCYSFSFHW